MISGSRSDAPRDSGAWCIGTVWDIPVLLDGSALLTLGLVTSSYALRWYNTQLDWSSYQIGITGLVMGLLLFGSILIHELAHSFVARQQGIAVRSIRLFLLGGIATIQQEAQSPRGTIQLAVAGPIASLGIAGCLWGLSLLLPDWGALPCAHLATVNTILGGFNLIPMLPLDGGHILSALIWKQTGDRLKGVRFAARLGQQLGGAGIGGGLAWCLANQDISGAWAAFVGWFIFRNAGRYLGVAKLQQTLLDLKVRDLPVHQGQVLEANQSVSQFVQEYLASSLEPERLYFMQIQSSPGVPRIFCLDLDLLQALERSQWETVPIATFKQSILPLSTDLPLSQAILQLEDEPTKQAVVLPAPDLPSDGQVCISSVGWIDCGTVVTKVAETLDLVLSDTEVEQTRITGDYPPRLPLKAAAQALNWMESQTSLPT